MTCRDFQSQLYEYVDGTISGPGAAAAEQHLAGCSACREAVQREESLAAEMTRRLRQSTEGLTLRSDVKRRILAAWLGPATPRRIGDAWVLFLNRFAVKLAGAVALVAVACVLTLNYSGWRKSSQPTAQRSGAEAQTGVAVLISQRVPVGKSYRDGDQVFDTITYETVVVSATLPAPTGKFFPQKPGPKTTL